MASVSELLLQGLKSVFSDVAEDELTEGLKSTLKGLAENSSKDVVETLSKESAENIGKIISHDVEHLGASSLEDYLGKTSIFKNADDLGGIISELVKNGDIVRDTGEAVKETGKEVLNNTVEKVAENIADIKDAIKNTQAEENILNEAPGEIIDNINTQAEEDILNEAPGEIIDEPNVKNTSAKSEPEQIYDYLSKEGKNKVKKERTTDLNSYKRYRTAKGFDDILNKYDKGEFDDPRLMKMGKILDTESSKLTREQVKDMANREIRDAATRKTTASDYLGYYKIPQIATGVFGTAWLVNRMSDRRGEQTNAQLYNQQQPYR